MDNIDTASLSPLGGTILLQGNEHVQNVKLVRAWALVFEINNPLLYLQLTGQVVGLLHCDQHVQANPSHWMCHDWAQWYVSLCFSL